MSPPKTLAIIPGRGGSKRLPRKNILPIGGRPLIDYSIEAAVASKQFAKIIVDSDDDEILSRADAHDGVEPHPRPASLATDTTKVIELILKIADSSLGREHDAIALLLPTCPFRRAQDLRTGMSLLTEDVDSVVSLTAFEFPHSMATNLDEHGILQPVFVPSPLITGNTRSQDHPPTYRPNGAFYIAWRERLLEMGNYFNGRVIGHVMPRLNSVDVDEEIDLRYAEILLSEGAVTLDY